MLPFLLMKPLIAALTLSSALISGHALAQSHRSFAELKADRLQKIADYTSCVEKAETFEEMKSCRPRF